MYTYQRVAAQLILKQEKATPIIFSRLAVINAEKRKQFLFRYTIPCHIKLLLPKEIFLNVI